MTLRIRWAGRRWCPRQGEQIYHWIHTLGPRGDAAQNCSRRRHRAPARPQSFLTALPLNFVARYTVQICAHTTHSHIIHCRERLYQAKRTTCLARSAEERRKRGGGGRAGPHHHANVHVEHAERQRNPVEVDDLDRDPHVQRREEQTARELPVVLTQPLLDFGGGLVADKIRGVPVRRALAGQGGTGVAVCWRRSGAGSPPDAAS